MIKREFVVDTHSDNQRLDNFILKLNRKLRKALIYKLIRKKDIRVNGKRTKHDYRLLVDDVVTLPSALLNPVQKPAAQVRQQPIELDILYEDEDYVIINKPSGLAVHAGSGIVTSLIDVLTDRYSGETPYLAHRLDRRTSGCIVVAKNRTALLDFQNQLTQRAVNKVYMAMVTGFWPYPLSQVEWDYPIDRLDQPGCRRSMTVGAAGKRALTHVKRVSSRGDVHQLELRPITGRTHQLRVHCRHVDLPIIGDETYGDHRKNREFNRLLAKKPMLLHAVSIEFQHRSKSRSVKVTAPLPGDFQRVLDANSNLT